MSEAPDNQELARRLAVLEERMNTMGQRYDKGWALLREDMAKRDAEAAKRDARRDVETAKRDAEAARRDKDNLRWQIGLWIATVVILGIIVRWPAVTTGSP